MKKIYFGQNKISLIKVFYLQVGMLHVAYKMKYTQPELLESLLKVFYMFDIFIWEKDRDEPDAIGIKCKNCNRDIGYTIQNIPFKNSSLILLLKLCFRMLDLHGLLKTTRTSTLIFNNCVLIGWVMVHYIIQQYYHTFMDIH